MSINGSRSTFPAVVDDWGEEFINNACQIVQAEDFNRIQDACFTTEIKTRRSFITGKTGVLTHPTSGSARPHIMYKMFTVSLTGSATATKTAVIPGPLFNTAEKDMFGGTPFASGNLTHVQIRRVPGDANKARSYHCGLVLPADKSGDDGLQVVASTLRHGNNDLTISAGTYAVSLMITNH